MHAVQTQPQHSQSEPPCRAAATISHYCGNGKDGAKRRGNKGQSRFRGHSRWFTESCNEVISSEPVKPAILTQNRPLVEELSVTQSDALPSFVIRALALNKSIKRRGVSHSA